VHRSFYDIGTQATEAFENVRAQAAQFINASSAQSIIFTPNATGALNLAAYLEEQRLQPGDEILISVAGHHSNILPWQRLAKRTGAILKWIEITAEGRLDIEDFKQKLSDKNRLVAVEHVSNVLGYLTPLSEIITAAHDVGARVVVDTAQSAARLPLDVQALDIDYVAVSGHKLYGPTGTGWLYAKPELLQNMEPQLVGGGTITTVTRDEVIWNDVPLRFEAGTPHIAGVVGLGAALTYIEKIGMDIVWAHDQAITAYALEQLQQLPEVTMYGPTTAEQRAGVISFSIMVNEERIHSHDLTTIADQQGVAVRAGQHCSHPLLQALQLPEVTRVSTGVYTTKFDIDRLIQALQAVIRTFQRGRK
jgi:cysteine desulfurase / selenocysteine lyase